MMTDVWMRCICGLQSPSERQMFIHWSTARHVAPWIRRWAMKMRMELRGKI